MRTLSVTTLLCFVGNILLAQSQHKAFKLEEKLSFHTPTRFFIKDVIDERDDTSNIGYVDVGLFNKKVPATIANGLANGIKSMVMRDLIRDSSLVPVLLVIKNLQVSESRTLTSEHALVNTSFEFITFIGQKKLVLTKYSSTTHSSSELDVTHSHPKLIALAVSNSLSEFDSWLNENYLNLPIYEDVKVNVQFHTVNQSAKDTLFYSADSKLKLSDFKLVGNSTDSLDAKSFLGLGYNVMPSVHNGHLQLDVTVNCFFIPEKSWVRPGKLNEELLGHEQLHFDIAYLVSRRLRNSLLSHKFSRESFREEIEQIKNQSSAEYDQLQIQYDEDTNHGRKRDQQNLWEKKIQSALEGNVESLFK